MKRPFSHRLFSALLALLVLTASVGMAVLERTCRQSGNRTTAVVFSTPRPRCPAPALARKTTPQATKGQVSNSCCDFRAHLHKLDTPAPELAWVKLLPSVAVPDWLAATAWPQVSAVPLIVACAAAWHASDSSPPPRAGRQLLAFIQMLVI